MNTKKIIYTVVIAALGAAGITGCADNDVIDLKPQPEIDDNAPFLEALKVFYADSPEDDIEIPVVNPNDHTDNFEATQLLNDGFHNDTINNVVDTLFFSQLVSGKLVPFQAVDPQHYPDNMPQNMREKYQDGYPNVYAYYYNDRYSVDWNDDPGGYNFFPTDTVTKMDWDVVKYWGLNNTGYALYGLFYPYNNKLPYDESGNLSFKVEEDQTTIDALRKSNFIGAYHSSSKSGQRLKFRLYHLTSYIKVTLYVPVFNAHDTIINEAGKKVEVRTGFPADALQSAEVRNVYNNFRINWYGGRSSDSAPITAVISDGQTRTDIKMYMPPVEEYPDSLPPVVRVKLSDFIRDAASKENLPEYDDCWQITLSALIPAGQDYPIGDDRYPNGQKWTDLNFLRFNVRENIGEALKSYAFTGLSSYGLIGSGDALNIDQGRIQHLSLYLPRYGAEAVLLGATVTPWEEWYNDNMGLRQEDPDPTKPATPKPDPDQPDEPDPENPDNN